MHLSLLIPFEFGFVFGVAEFLRVADAYTLIGLGFAAQEVFVDPARDESLIFELLDLKGEVEDGGSALWFLRDIANEQDAGDNLVRITC